MNRLELRNKELESILNEDFKEWRLNYYDRNINLLKKTKEKTEEIISILKKIQKFIFTKTTFRKFKHPSHIYISIKKDFSTGYIEIHQNLEDYPTLESIIKKLESFLQKIEKELSYWLDPIPLYTRDEKGKIRKIEAV